MSSANDHRGQSPLDSTASDALRGKPLQRDDQLFGGKAASAPSWRMMSSWAVGNFALTFFWTSADVLEDATAASKASRYARVASIAPASSFCLGSLWPAMT